MNKKSDEFSIGLASLEDCKNLHAVLRLIYHESDFFIQEFDEAYPDLSSLKERLFKLHETGKGYYFVGKLGDEIIGFVRYKTSPSLKVRHVCWRSIGLLSAYRGKGFGKSMVTESESWLSSNTDLLMINLMVREDNHRAIKFNEKTGFSRVGVLENDTQVKGRFYNGLLMQKQIKKLE